MPTSNTHGQPVGDPVCWSGTHSPEPLVLTGRHVLLRPLTEQDALQRTRAATEAQYLLARHGVEVRSLGSLRAALH